MSNPVLQNDSQNFHGIFIGPAKIVAARSISNEDIYKNGKPVDVGIEFTLDIVKSDGTILQFSNGDKPKFSVAGNFKVENGEVTGTGSATTVKIALQRLGVKWERLNPDNSIPQEILDQCIGKEIVRLQFPYKKADDGVKNKYKTFKQFYLASVPNAKEKLRAEFDKAVAGGYEKPLEDEDTSFPGSAVAEQEVDVKIF